MTLHRKYSLKYQKIILLKQSASCPADYLPQSLYFIILPIFICFEQIMLTFLPEIQYIN